MMIDNKDLEFVDFVVDAEEYRTTVTTKYKNRPLWQPKQAGEINSSLPGTIKEIVVKEGDVVKKGQLLLVLEAMKMLNRIVAPESGTISAINVKEGDKISKNHLMIKMDI
jgi:Acetyl/propionyl-CoA carboxylase, alpha subunit